MVSTEIVTDHQAERESRAILATLVATAIYLDWQPERNSHLASCTCTALASNHDALAGYCDHCGQSVAPREALDRVSEQIVGAIRDWVGGDILRLSMASSALRLFGAGPLSLDAWLPLPPEGAAAPTEVSRG